MKTIIFIISLIVLSSVFVSAQIDIEKKPEWKLFTPPSEEFSVEIPDTLKYYVYDQKNKNLRYSGMLGETYFFIFSDSLKNAAQYDFAMKFVETSQNIEFENQKNSDTKTFQFSDNENFYHIIYAVKTKKRAYVFHLVSQNKFDPNVKRFYSNLKINQQNASIKIEDEIPLIDIPSGVVIKKPVEIKSQPINQPKVTATNESGNGSGAGIASSDMLKNPENSTLNSKPLNITLKPNPSYTDFARFYGITGDVRMRTTFLQSGTIGSTTPVTKLPFGLTNSAITAAKQIRFEPQTVKGKGVSVTKVVVFRFTIY